MTYAQYGLIQASDFNTLQTNFDLIWDVGTGSFGYGQPYNVVKVVGDDVIAVDWQELRSLILQAGNHQSTLLSAMNAVTQYNKIEVINNIASNIALLNDNRLNAASQGSVQYNTYTNIVQWKEYLKFTWTVNFGSHDAARYFFNAGGQIGFGAYHPPGAEYDIDQLISDLCGDLGTLWVSSPGAFGIPTTVKLSGGTFRGVEKIGGGPIAVVNNANGFYSYNASPKQLIVLRSDFYYFPYSDSTYLQMTGAYNGSGELTFEQLMDEVPGTEFVTAGTQSSLYFKPPSTNYISNSWGAPVIACSVAFA